MELVLSTHHLASIGGSETYLVTVAEHLGRLGHQVTMHAVEQGEMADWARSRGVAVAAGERDLPDHCDGVLAQDAATSLALADRYPQAPQVFVSHGIAFDWMLPPQLPGVIGAVVAMNDRTARRAAASALRPDVRRLRQPIDLERFAPRGTPSDPPRRALLLGNYIHGARRDAVAAVCDELGIETEHIGAHGSASTPEPESAVAAADIVIGYGRAALESMAAGRAVYVYDDRGGDGWVTPESYPALEANGFAGGATAEVVDAERLRSDLERYRPEMGELNRDLARAHHDALRHAVELSELFAELAPREGPPPGPLREMSRLVRSQWHSDGRAASLALESGRLRKQVEELEYEVARLRGEVDRHAGDRDEFERTRRYRTALALGKPLDLARRRLNGKRDDG